MIIVEGPDGSGKTTLIGQLRDSLNIPVGPKVVQSDMSSSIDVFEWMMAEMGTWPKPILYDRFAMISEFIYGPIFNEGLRPGFDTEATRSKAQQVFGGYHPLVIFCMPSLEVVQENLRYDTANELAKTEIEAVYRAYQGQAAMYGNTVYWDYTRDNYDLMLQAVVTKNTAKHGIDYDIS